MQIVRIDHLVLTVQDIAASCDFYSRALGMKVVSFGDNRKALSFGAHKINLHQQGHEFEPKAACPTPGSGDLCLVSSVPISSVVAHLEAVGVPIIEGPVQRTGALGPVMSVYLRDPDSNLIEISSYGET